MLTGRMHRLVRQHLPPDDSVTRRNLVYRQLFQQFDRIYMQVTTVEGILSRSFSHSPTETLADTHERDSGKLSRGHTSRNIRYAVTKYKNPVILILPRLFVVYNY